VLAGDPALSSFRALAAVLHEKPGPRRILLGADGGEGQRWLAARAPWLGAMSRSSGAGGLRLRGVCLPGPRDDPAELRGLLS